MSLGQALECHGRATIQLTWHATMLAVHDNSQSRGISYSETIAYRATAWATQEATSSAWSSIYFAIHNLTEEIR
jgi:hypothetical protein